MLSWFLKMILISIGGMTTMGNLYGQGLDQMASHWQAILDKHLKDGGRIDYRGMAQDLPNLKAFLKLYDAIDLSESTDNEKKAAYINLYNAAMIHHLLNYASAQKIDLNSNSFLEIEVNKIKVPGGNIWNGSYTTRLAGKDLTLDDIEHRLIRGKKVGELTHLQVKTLDPRIHAAVNCAALSCPPIHPKAFNAQNIDDLLQESMVAFLSSDAHFYQASENKMVLNSIVYWYYSDFDEHGQNLRGFSGAGDYLAQFIRPNAKDRDWKISHFKQKFNDKSKLSLKLSSAWSFDYDWRVNDARNQPRKLK